MGTESIIMEKQASVHEEEESELPSTPYYLAKFKLYETRSNFYMVGRDKSKRIWRILKIDRSEPSELIISEDPTLYSFQECCVLLKCIHEGNKNIGGLKFVSTCYGIVGFIKFLGPYYALLITERRKIGMVCGHAIYAVAKSKMIPIPHSTVQSNMDNPKNENRSFVHSACICKTYLVLVKRPNIQFILSFFFLFIPTLEPICYGFRSFFLT